MEVRALLGMLVKEVSMKRYEVMADDYLLLLETSDKEEAFTFVKSLDVVLFHLDPSNMFCESDYVRYDFIRITEYDNSSDEYGTVIYSWDIWDGEEHYGSFPAYDRTTLMEIRLVEAAERNVKANDKGRK